jgi:CubicO group peptidase (beta-lactamase class C family)
MRWIASIAGLGCAFLAAGAAAEPITRDQVVAALPKLEALAQKQIDSGGVPGLAIAVVYKDEVVYLKGFGLRETGKPDRVDADTVFQIASLSKPVSATVVAALVSEGIVDWGSRVSELDPSLALKDPYPTQQVTIRDFFNHRSGLPGNAGDDLEDIGYGRVEVMHRLRLVPPSSSFRAGYAYSNAGLTAGALAAAMPTGKSWEDVAEEKLYRPLGMEQTSSRHADFLSRENRSALHIGGVSKWEAKLKRDATAQAPAGGVSASARDLAKWMRLELANGKFDGRQVIGEAALAATHVPLMARGNNPVTGGASFYGLGWNVEFGRYGLSWGHAGAFSVGARTQVTLYPEQQLGILVLANAFPTGVPEGLADSFADLVFKGSVEKDWIGDWNGIYGGMFAPVIEAAKQAFGTKPTPATSALPAAAYTGNYANDYVGPASVTAEGEALTLKVGPGGKIVYPMTHFDRDLFLIYPDAEMGDMPSPVTFAIGPDGKAASVTIDNLNVNGLGVLARSGE